MKCGGVVNGQPCQAEVLLTFKFCPECGCAVKPNSKEAVPCPGCNTLVVEGQKCPCCNWKIDPSIPIDKSEDLGSGIRLDVPKNADKLVEDSKSEQQVTDKTENQQKVSDNPYSGSTRAIVKSESDCHPGDGSQFKTNNFQEPVFGAGKQATQGNTVSLSAAARSEFFRDFFKAGEENLTSRFQSSAIFGNLNWNKGVRSVHATGSVAFEHGISSHPISENNEGLNDNHSAVGAESTSEDTNLGSDLSEDDSMTNSGSVTSGVDVQDLHAQKKKRPNKKTRDRKRKQQAELANISDGQGKILAKSSDGNLDRNSNQEPRDNINKGLDRGDSNSKPNVVDKNTNVPDDEVKNRNKPDGGGKNKDTPNGDQNKDTPDGKNKATPVGDTNKDTPDGGDKNKNKHDRDKNKDTPVGEKNKDTPDGGDKNKNKPDRDKNKDTPVGEKNKDTPDGRDKNKNKPDGGGKNKDTPNGNKNKNTPDGDKNKDTPDGDKNKNTPDGDKNKKTPDGDKNKNTPDGDKNKNTPDGVGKNKNTPDGDKNKDTPVGEKNKDTPDGRDKNKNKPDGGGKNKDTPNGNKNKNTPDGDKNKDTPDGDKNKNTPDGDKNKKTPDGDKNKNTPDGDKNKNTPDGVGKNKNTPDGDKNKNTPDGDKNKNTPDGDKNKNTPDGDKNKNTPDGDKNTNTPDGHKNKNLPDGDKNKDTPENSNKRKIENNHDMKDSKQETNSKEKKSKTGGNNSQQPQTTSDSGQVKTYAEIASGANVTQTSGLYLNIFAQNVSGGFVDICFHAIFSPSILQNSEKDVAFIEFRTWDFYRGWSAVQYYMQKESDWKDGFVKYSFQAKFLPFVIEELCPVYTYGVQRNGVQNQFVMEHVAYRGQLTQKGGNRILMLPKNFQRGLFHIYDGVVREHPENKSKKYFAVFGVLKEAYDSVKEKLGLDDYRKVLKKDAELSILAFHPKWQLHSMNSDGINGQEMINHIGYIISGLRNVYSHTADIWSHNDFDKVVAGFLFPKVKRALKELFNRKKENLTQEGQILHLVTAVTLAYMVGRHAIDLDSECRTLLSEALLPSPDFKSKVLPDIAGLKMYFSQDKLCNVGQYVLMFAQKIAKENKNPCWLFCVPVIHFLLNKCRPFEEPSDQVNHSEKSPVWWGVDMFQGAHDRFQEKSIPWERPINQMLDRLAPFFELDYLLPRTFMVALQLKEREAIIPTGHISPDVTLASVFYYLKSFSKEQATLQKILQMVSEQCCKEPNISLTTLKNSWRAYKIAEDVFKESIKQSSNKDLHLPCFEAFLVNVDMFDKILNGLKELKTDEKSLAFKDNHWKTFLDVTKLLSKYLSNERFVDEELAYLKLWNSAFSIKVLDGKIKENYIQYLENDLKTALHGKNAEKILEIYCMNSQMFTGKVQEILIQEALKAVVKANFNFKMIKEDFQLMRYGSLLSEVMRKNFAAEKVDGGSLCLEHILSFTAFPTYMEIYYNYGKILQADSYKLLSEIIATLQTIVKKLMDGSIIVKDLRIVLINGENFWKTVSMLKDLDQERIISTLTVRQTEMETFEKTKHVIQKFVGHCLHCQGEDSKLVEKLRTLETVESFSLNNLVKTISLDETQNMGEYKPIISIFEFSSEELEILSTINDHCQSMLFMKLWEKRGNDLFGQKSRSLAIKEVLEEVWIPTSEQWNRLCRELENGDIKFSEFEDFFNKTKIVNIQEELQRIANDGNAGWIQERLDQVEKYRSLESCRIGAEAILEVVNEFELDGNFSQIYDVLQLTRGVDTSMNKLDHSLLNTCSILKEVTVKRAECLKTFIKCKPLVEWLRESMPSGLKELKVFVDLASISAGEGDMEIDKVNCLHSATTGYGPLIFNLKKDCDIKEFLAKCQEVWKELDSDPHLPQKLVDTTRQLAWLQTVKRSHGSVEVSSLAQAEAINSRGIYQLGNVKKLDSLKKPCLTEVLELQVTEEEGQTLQRKRYTYEHLHDLQSRLMLVAGKAEKGKDEVDRFMLILDSVVRLGNIYTKLVADGCVLFTHWHVKFLCDKSRHACAFLNFGFGKDTHTIKGRVDENEDVSAIIPNLARYLEDCHEKWLDYIDEKRQKYYTLNFFTVDQMVILQQELVKLKTSKNPSDFIYPLLSAVKTKCTKEDLLVAMKLAKSDVDGFHFVNHNLQEAGDTEESTDASEDESDDLKTRKFLQELTKAGYPLKLAKRALDHVDVDKIDDGIVWCLDNEEEYLPDNNDDFVIKPSVEEDDLFTGWTQSDQSLSSVTAHLVQQLGVGTQEKSAENLIKDLEDLWENFLTSVSSSVSDYLSVEHLGLILNRLAEQETLEVERTLLSCFKRGEPNLLICPQSEIYNTVLSVYSHEDDRPLPQSDEVLLCTPQTTLDMLEIFWRRALYIDTNNNKIHCLVNADLLDYDVSDKGEKSLERHMKYAESKDTKYKLVVICSSENEYKSRIVAALDKYHRPQLPIDVHNVRKYLLNKLRVDATEGVSASSVDFNSCSVRVVKSWRAGVGKTLYKKRMVTKLDQLLPDEPRQWSASVTIPLHEKTVDTDAIMNVFLTEILPPKCHQARIFHLDISHEVQEGVDALLFQLLVLGCLGHSSGHVWRKSEVDYYIIESMPLLGRDSDMQEGKLKCVHHCLDILPEVICRSPQESLDILNKVKFPSDYTVKDRIFDSKEFKRDVFQRPYQYLTRLDANRKLDDVRANHPEGDKSHCLQVLLRHCGIKDPSWSELHHFVSFLNKQLQDFEVSAYCGQAAGQDLPGFAKFVLRFLIQMSRDFSTRSLKVSEESPIQMLQRQLVEEEEETDEGDEVLQQYQMRRTWETSPHPYLFFNPDHHSMTFLGFNLDRKTGNLVDQQTGNILEQRIMEQNLFDALVRNRVNLAEKFDALPRAQKIEKLCNVMGQIFPHDPDSTYELTTDNVKKMLAIYMRFRCEIPVIIMGETGCGKTRLIKFMCSLQQPPGVNVQNMILMKVHGGTKASDIIKKVRKAEEMARENAAQYPHMDTVLFFDEANTTEAIGVIKEIMCDKSLEGRPIQLHERLKIVAACNPYRKHSEKLIKRLEKAGLGYHVDAEKTTDRLGRVPMRRLVYRVQPLPQSMLPLVWDFGQLDTDVEEMYIRQMVLRYINNDRLPKLPGLDSVTSKILTESQQFMRNQKDECSFVSLRDVERVLEVMCWFYEQRDNDILFQQMNTNDDIVDIFDDDSDNENEENTFDDESDNENEENIFDDDRDNENEENKIAERQQPLSDVTRSLVLALGVCYHACLKNREEYREAVAEFFRHPLELPGGADQIEDEIVRCQSVFLDNVDLADNIARNQALMENVFMMVVCIELRIPMFLVGKPGSSKSLAKTIVADAMQGNAAHKDLFKNYKQVQMVSFQCSPLSTPDGIMGTFRQCAAYQKDKNLDRFVSIVVLDEIGLAEDSPKMPLKTLHPLLEDGCPDDEDPEPHKKVAFIGISNWALDPAKMNRGILVQREVPDEQELINSAHGICSTDDDVLNALRSMIPSMASSYLKLFDETSTEMREFFGLRDFYSLVKMLFAFVKTSGHKPTWPQLKHSILRNFGGLENVEPVDVFYQNLSSFIIKDQKPSDTDPDCTPYGMIQACLKGDSQSDSESRYLLLLTENYGALTILQQKIFTMENAVVIFGSSFPSDQEYTQVCRNINRIKVCMETGSTVILLNLENLYESLYDALNQYYVRFGGEKYVDLGLGTHRVKCRVHEHFRLIVVAEKQIVYNKFPIPLINRLEKHFLSLKTMLTPEQLELTDKLQKWAHSLCENKSPAHYAQRKVIRKIGDAFMGYHDDTCAAIILHVCQEKRCDDQAIPEIEKEILTEAQSIMLWCATPAAVWEQEMAVFSIYFREQHHDSLVDYLHYKMVDQQQHNIHAQITTNSKLLSTADIEILCRFIRIQRQNVTLLTLQSFDTEQQFSRKIRSCFDQCDGSDMLLIVQCDSGDQNADLIACARYTVQGELQVQGERTYAIHVVFLIQLPGISGGCFTGFQCGLWHSVHIDDLHPSPEDIPSVADMHGKTVSALLSPSKVTNHHDNFVEEQDNQMGKQDDVSLEDINFEETALDKIVCPKRHFDINHLMLNCVQPALARVKDLEKDSNRGTGRLKIVLNLLNNTTGIADHLLDGIAFHLMKILSEKEESVGGHLTANWLSTETGNINRAGTFRRFAVHCLHAKVIPILASIIAFIDTNRNLDILTRSDHQSWKFDLWLQIFSNSEITQLKYSNVVSPTRQSELQEVIVKSTSLEGKVFSAVLPFSWLIFRQIDDILKTVKETEGLKDLNFDVVMKAAELLGDLPLGKLLNGFHGDVNMAILQLYTTDFVHMVYPVQTESECKIICENVMIGCRQLIRGEFGRLLPSLFGFHMTYILYAARFKNFSYMVSVWPECSQRVMDFQEHKSMYLVTDEEICLDVLALHLLTKNLEPREDELNSPASRIKWLRQVCDYRPIVERILGLGDAKNCQFGERCKRGIQEARHQWTRAIVVKLFIEHVCTENRAESEIKRCRPLWVALGNETDMKNKESLEVIEKFLRGCNRKIVASYFGKDVKCSSCENHVEGAPVTLPCQHVVCRKCFEDFKTLSELECTQCHVPFPADFNPDVEPGKGGNITKYQDYRRRCNTFFMEIVSQLCFAEGTPPSHDVVQKLLSYITGERRGRGGARIVSRELTIFEDSFDPTPVVRSFLLQQLMQTSGEEVDRYLETYFNHTSKLLGTEDQKQLVELCLLVLQCLEDSHHQQNSRRSHVSDSLQYTDSTSTEDETIIVKDLLTAASQQIFTDIGTLDCIKYIASVRFALSVVAKYIHHMYGSTQKTIKLNSNIRRMFAAAAQLSEDCGSPWPKNYFIKQLCRCYSIDSYYSVLTKKDVSFLSWVQLPQINVEQVNDCFDRYIMCGQEYLHIRETVLQTLLNEEGTEITDILQKIPIEAEWQTRVNVMLAVHRLITMSYVKEEEHQTVSAEGKAYLIQLITNNWTRLKDKALTTDMLHNTMWKLERYRNINVDMDLAQQNIACLLTHFLILMSEIPGKTTLVTPLQLLSLQPHRMRNSFYPTMPEDEVADVREALLAARQANPNENPVFYRCPNGHPYVIGDCGRPQVEHKCNVCGKQIGGTKHVLRPDNEKDQGKDRTETGHILGRATTLGPVVAPERKLNRASFAILRLLTHISMYVGANVSAEAVVDSIKPDIEQEDLASYLMEHIELDLTMIQSAVGKNKDDVLVLIHFILSRVMEVHTTAVIGAEVPEGICRLTSRDGRAKWEKLFVEKYITPVLQDIDSVVTTWNDRIINDRKLGSDHLLQILYEKNAVETESLDNLWDIPAVWRYKARISVDHLMQTLNISKQKCPVLRLFLKEEYHLRVIRFAPSILRLHKLLIQKYNKKLDRTEANLLKLENVKENMHQDGKLEEFESLLADFIEAWDCVRESLETYVCPANQTVISVNREYCKTRITDSTPVSYLLPTYKDTGLCSFVLLYFLMDKQNIFLGNYCHRRNISEDSLPKVHVKDISSAHLISYHPDRDLLPMVLANCNYSFEVGQGTRVDYNVTNLERQLMDRFLFSKSFISHIQEIETFTHRAESTNAVVFKVLSQRIKQERLHQSVQSQIHRELHAKAYPDLCESLDKLDIAISFLKSVGSDPDSSLYDFMTNTLKMDSAFPSPKAQQVSKCKHTMSWWVTLALERAKRLTKHKQEVFEGLSENLKEDLNEEQKKVTEEIVNSLPLEHIDILVTLVFECIVLKIDIPQNKDEDDYVDMSNISLHDTLTAYISASPYDEDKLVDQILITAIGRLPTDPQDQNRIMTGQSVSFWKFINRLLISKQQQRL